MAQSQKSFIVTDKNGNSQFVQSLMFQKNETDNKFSWRTNEDSKDYQQNRDIKDIHFIARTNYTLSSGSSDEVTKILRDLTGKELADAEAIATTVKENSNVEESFTEDNANVIVKMKGDESYIAYPLYEDTPLFSEEFLNEETTIANLAKQKKARTKASAGYNVNGKVAIFNQFHGLSDYKVQNRMVSYLKVMFELHDYEVEYYGNRADPAHLGNINYDQLFDRERLNDVISNSKDYDAIIIFAHGFIFKGKSYFSTREAVSDNPKEVLCYMEEEGKDVKYYAYPVENLKVDNSCVVYLGSCFGAPKYGFPSEEYVFPNSTHTPLIAWDGENCVAQADASLLFYYILFEGCNLEAALHLSYQRDEKHIGTKRVSSHYVDDRTFERNESYTPSYADGIKIKLTRTKQRAIDKDGPYYQEKIDYSIEGTFPSEIKYIRIGLKPVLWNDMQEDGRRASVGFHVDDNVGSVTYSLRNVPEGLYVFCVDVFSPGAGQKTKWKRVRQTQRNQYLLISNSLNDNAAIPVTTTESNQAPYIVDSEGISLTSITLTAGISKTFQIDGCSEHTFNAVSVDKNVAEVSVEEKTLTVKGKGEGTTFIGAYDVQNKQMAIVKVTVEVGEDLSLSNNDLIMKIGEEDKIKINGGSGKYKVECRDNEVAKVELVDSVITVYGIGGGACLLVITDVAQNITRYAMVSVIHNNSNENIVYPKDHYSISEDGKTLDGWFGNEEYINLGADPAFNDIDTVYFNVYSDNEYMKKIHLVVPNHIKYIFCSNIGFCEIEDGNDSIVVDSSSKHLYLGRTTRQTVMFQDEVKTLVFGDKVKSYDVSDMSFYEGRDLELLRFGRSMTTLADRVFEGCNNIEFLKFPGSMQKIGFTFRDCTNLKRVVFEDNDSILDIVSNAFYGCHIKSVYVGRDINSDNHNSIFNIYHDDPGLDEVTLGRGYTGKFSGLFTSHQNLKKVVIKNGVTGINDFISCKCIKSVNIPSSVNTIYGNAFVDCDSLFAITIPSSVKRIEQGAFKWTPIKTLIVEDSSDSLIWDETYYTFLEPEYMYMGRKISAGEFALCRMPVTELIIGDKITGPILVEEFKLCEHLELLTIGKGITKIGMNAFMNSPLKEVHARPTTPPECDDWAFWIEEIGSCKLYVPKNCKSKYESSAVWKEFGAIIEEDE